MKKAKPADNTIIINRKARHDYTFEERFEAGLALEGWEVKSLRARHVQLQDSHVIVRHNTRDLVTSEADLRSSKLRAVVKA